MRPTYLRHKTSDALLVLTVLAGVDDRVDETVDVHEYGDNVVPPCSVDDSTSAVSDVVWRETDDKATAYHQRRDGCVTSRSVYSMRTSIRSSLQQKQ